jgi:hypothetical protein
MEAPQRGTFRISGRTYEWHDVPASPERLIHVQSGQFILRILVQTHWPSLGPVASIGGEFPPGEPAVDPPFLLLGYERDRHGLIHTELVKSIVQRCVHRRRYRRQPLDERWRASFGLPIDEYPESEEERLAREHREEASRKEREETARRLQEVARKDALITDKRCPDCGAPCPSYRKTCKHCGRDVRE